ncbi:MAG: restriction endonuclease subunit S [Wenzhouxiangella sp.]|jgi:type I restriction enzyme S subunit|nr:restriction endonuclease subunit S [Wenzhouxiangella sp.]
MSPPSALRQRETIPLRYVCRLNPSVSFEEFDEEDELTFLPMERVKNGHFIPNTTKFSNYSPSYNAFENGDIVLAKVTPCFENGNIAIVNDLVGGKGFGSSELFVVRPEKAERRFLLYYFQSLRFKQEGEASMTGAGGLKRVSPDMLRRHHLPFPPKDEQNNIAEYLDHETSQIDALVAEKERMLALLEDKRAALISRAVTRGLNPKAPTKPSGLDWLGQIPKHWEVQRCATLFTEKDERGEPELPLLNVSLNTGVTLRVFSEDKIESMAADLGTMKIARANDLVFNKMRFWQGAAGIAPADGLVSPDYTVASISTELVPKYIGELFRIRLFNGEVKRYSYGMVDDRLRLYWHAFKNIRVPIPPIKEQEAIVGEISAYRKKTAMLTAALVDSIKLLKERRSALITAAVTGKFDL